MAYIKFQPLYQKRVWGGRNLELQLDRTLPENSIIGESWEIVDRSNIQSIVKEGGYKGSSLRELLLHHSAVIMGPIWDPNCPFPVLVKWLDCRERLSLQVHPPLEVANRLHGEPKDEAWFIAYAEKNSSILAGVKPGVDRKRFASALYKEELESLVPKISVQPGDSIYIPSGRLHAIDGGSLILEIQQNSDTTYRVHDWGRIGLNGKPRQLHINESMECINFSDIEPTINRNVVGDQLIAQCPSFRIQKILLDPQNSDHLIINQFEQPRLMSVVAGRLKNMKDEFILQKGDNVLLPYSENFVFKPEIESVLLLTDKFVLV